jgi:hypothetical protein
MKGMMPIMVDSLNYTGVCRVLNRGINTLEAPPLLGYTGVCILNGRAHAGYFIKLLTHIIESRARITPLHTPAYPAHPLLHKAYSYTGVFFRYAHPCFIKDLS